MAKPFLTYDAQLHKLSNDKKLIVNDPDQAKEILKNIGYFSLIGGYKTPFVNPMTRIYQNNTTFDDVYALYQFDRNLRELLFKYLCEIEQRIRQLISYSFCNTHGEQQMAYLDPHNYNNTPKNTADINKLISILSYQANRNTEHPYILYQRTTYGNVPLWVLVNTLTFGQISKLYALLPSKLQSDISKEYHSVNERTLEKYLRLFTLFRNACAHNERLYSFRTQIDFPDTDLHRKLGIAKQGNQYLYGKRDLFGLILAMRYILPKESFLSFKRQLTTTIRKYLRQSSRINESTLLAMMGFPANWSALTRYRL